ncbi:E2/UBC family protein [Methylotuvimicrobium sp.]|uniref:E2/UBC family protein n=1 Tax=Methylotuvimicrobium sp. TaxID=2822413 RepID=UPI003D651C02
MLEARYIQAIDRVEILLGHLNDVRVLSAQELSVYKMGFSIGWEIPSLCEGSDYRLRLLLSKDFPFKPPRVAVAPVPKILTWPHLENKGILCLLPESAAHSLEDIESVVLTLLESARKLVLDSLLSEGFDEFEDEFNSYWERWIKNAPKISVLCQPVGPSRWVSSWHSTLGAIIAEDDTTLRHWLQNLYGHNKEKTISPQPIPLLWLPRPLRPSEYPATAGALIDLLGNDEHAKSMLQQLLLDESAKYKTILLGFAGHRGVGFAGLRIGEIVQHRRTGKALYNGYRKQPPKDIMLMRYRSAPINGAYTKRYDAA